MGERRRFGFGWPSCVRLRVFADVGNAESNNLSTLPPDVLMNVCTMRSEASTLSSTSFFIVAFRVDSFCVAGETGTAKCIHAEASTIG